MTITTRGSRLISIKKEPGISHRKLPGAKGLGVAYKSGNHVLASALLSGARLGVTEGKEAKGLALAVENRRLNQNSSNFISRLSHSLYFIFSKFYICQGYGSLYLHCSAEDRIFFIEGT
ncbi:hypothetical protein KY335_04360 [Candidatus Woesearchaeota archaeon]|nr:hypothetical protein [Candidatus Woesearchaeota archaeon]